MATLVNGNGNAAVYAQQDADLYTGIEGNSTKILNVGSKLAATIEDSNTIAVADGVILTKEGRRIQVDVGNIDEFIIPTGQAGTTRYYIFGYHLYTDGSANQKCETFVQLMSNGSETITENTFRNGFNEVYVSLYRVKQDGLNLNTPAALLSIAETMADIIEDIDGINASLTEKVTQKEGNISVEGSTISSTALDWVTWDETNGRMILHKKGTGADAGFPFKSASEIGYDLTIESLTPSVSGGWRVKITSTTKINGVAFGYGMSSSGIDYSWLFAWSVANPSNIYAYYSRSSSSTVFKGEINDVFEQLRYPCNMQVISYDDYSLTVECSSAAYVYSPKTALAF